MVMIPRVCVVTVCYNCSSLIEDTILSVINQSYSNLFYVIIDGGSRDGTLDIIDKYKNSIDVIISERDNGIFDAMNKGIREASGSWLIFMNAGDTFFDLEVLSSVFENSDFSDFGVVYGSKFSDGRIVVPKDLSFLKYGGIMACHQSIFYNLDLLKGEMYYPVIHRFYGDIELTRRIYIKGFKFFQVNNVISNYLGGGFSSRVSWEARFAKFHYLYLHFGWKGIYYGMVGKFNYLIKI